MVVGVCRGWVAEGRHAVAIVVGSEGTKIQKEEETEERRRSARSVVLVSER
jgi:hypothetical protein